LFLEGKKRRSKGSHGRNKKWGRNKPTRSFATEGELNKREWADVTKGMSRRPTVLGKGTWSDWAEKGTKGLDSMGGVEKKAANGEIGALWGNWRRRERDESS